ncbi:MAG: M15 family metallopeptidase [Lachnospiraceae bacterium]|nr:M15 family metallopeptidase [Lachnospiraceae bacterium]
MKRKKHYARKITALVLTILAFTATASFSDSATATVMNKDVILVNNDGQKVAVNRSDIIKKDESSDEITKEDVELQEEDLERIVEDSEKAAKDFNRRNGLNENDSGILIEDENGNMVSPDFDDDWSLILINKDHLIPDDYTFELATITDSVTSDVRCAGALVKMIRGARNDNVYLYVASPFRDLERQTFVFNRKVESIMKEGYDYDEAYQMASEVVAIPGTSEHQVGLAFDLVTDGYWKLDEGFAYTDGGKWLAENAPDYGFILRYPKGKEDITKIEFEPWHYRYVGVKAAKEMQRLGLTLEEYDEMIGLVE